MKRTASIIIALLAFVYAATAQEKTKKTPEQKADMLTKKWTKVLSLTTEQVTEVQRIFLDRAQKVEAIKVKYSSEADKKTKQQEIKSVRIESDNALKQVFTPEQYATFIKAREENKKTNKDKKTEDFDSLED